MVRFKRIWDKFRIWLSLKITPFHHDEWVYINYFVKSTHITSGKNIDILNHNSRVYNSIINLLKLGKVIYKIETTELGSIRNTKISYINKNILIQI
jgi:hypothetical protein